jgi:hypothetical protein
MEGGHEHHLRSLGDHGLVRLSRHAPNVIRRPLEIAMRTESNERFMFEEFPTGEISTPVRADPRVDGPPPRTAWIVAIAVGLTLLIVAAAGGFFLTYQHQASVISRVRSERSTLAQALSATRGQLAAKSTALKSTEARLTTATQKLTATKKSLKATTADLQAAKSDATAQYSAGYSAGSGSTNVTYNQGWDAGYNSGWDYGYSACHADYYC